MENEEKSLLRLYESFLEPLRLAVLLLQNGYFSRLPQKETLVVLGQITIEVKLRDRLAFEAVFRDTGEASLEFKNVLQREGKEKFQDSTLPWREMAKTLIRLYEEEGRCVPERQYGKRQCVKRLTAAASDL